MRRTLTLAALATVQGFLGALSYGLDLVRRDIEKQARQQARKKRMVESVHATMEQL